MRVYVEDDMTVCHVSHVVKLKAGQIVEGPLATYLVESGCNVTVEDAPAPAAEGQTATGQESHTPGAGENEGGESGPDAETGEAG